MKLEHYGAERVNLSAPTFIPPVRYGQPITAPQVWSAAIQQARRELAYATANRWNIAAYVRRLTLTMSDAKRLTTNHK